MAVTKGITIEFRGNAAPLKSAINSIRNEAKSLDKELKYINNSLKFNPTSVTMWSQKQKVLKQEVTDTKARLKELQQIENQLTAQGVKRNSAEFREVEREIVKAKSQLKQFQKELTAVGSARLTALSQSFKQLGDKMTQMGTTLTTKITLPLALAGGTAAKKFAEVDKIMVLTNSTMGNTAEEAELLSKAMKDAAANSTYGMNDAATATLNFARAGLTAEQAAKALAPAMNLAAGEGGDLDTVSAGLVATINGFHGSFEDAGKYADVFANACNNSALDVNSLATAMSTAAPIFASAGYSVNDAAIYMGVMANAGIDADKAANSLKTGLARLVSPAKQGADMMEQLGISVTNADGSMKDTITIQQELHDSFATLSESEQIAAASAIFGKNQMAPWLALINTAPESVNELSTSIMAEGTANQMAADMMSGFGGSLEKLKSSIDVAATSLGEALAPTIEVVVGWIQKAVEWFNGLDDETKTMIATIGIAVAAVGPIILILGKLFTIVGTVIGGISKFIGVAKLLVSVLGGPVSIAIAAAIAIGVLLWKNWDTIKEKATQLKNWVVEKWTALKDGVVNTVTNLKNSVTNAFNSIKERALFYWTALKTGVTIIVDTISSWVTDKFNAVKNTVTGIFDSIKSTAVSVWNGIKSAITDPIQTAVDFVSGAIDRIRGFFGGLSLELPHIKLPHFSLTGSFSIVPPSVPHLSVDWWKSGGIFTKPTLLGGMNGVGEAGAEAVLPLKKLWDEMDKRFESGPTINVYGTPGMDVNELASLVEAKLISAQKRRRLAW